MIDSDLSELILNELQERMCAYGDVYPPFYIASIGAHLFNLRNIAHPIYFEGGRPVDTRVQVFFVTPSGFGKTFWLEHFIRQPMGMLCGTKIDHGFEGYMTEAGWVGTIRQTNGESEKVLGAAYKYRSGILGIEEFSALVEAMSTQHSRALDTALLTSLDSGWVYKKLALGAIEYRTGVTLWSGTQFARFDLTSGLGRRMTYLMFAPTQKDIDELRARRRNAKGIRYNPIRLDSLKKRINQKVEKLTNLEKIEFRTEQIYKLFDKFQLMHYEEPLFEKLILGHCVMKEDWNDTLVVELDSFQETMLKRELTWRNEIKRGSQFAQLLQLIKTSDGMVEVLKLRDMMVNFGYDWASTMELLQQLARHRIITVEKGFVKMWTRRETKED